MVEEIETDRVNIEGHSFVKEVPNQEVLREAAFYVQYGGPAGVVMELSKLEDYRMLSGRRPGWGLGSRFHIEQPLPPEIGEWVHYIFDFPLEKFSEFYSDVCIRGDRADWMTDILYHAMPLVSPLFKEAICDMDPDLNYFFPARIFDRESGKLIDDSYHFWLPRRRFSFVPKERREFDKRSAPPFPGAFSSPDVAWELMNNSALRSFVQDLPFWGKGYAISGVAYSSPSFHKLKSLGLSGLVENTADRMVFRNLNQCVGHF